MIIIWIIVSIILFSIIVLVHEWWHFSAARLFWVKVEEFGLWIPPRAKKLFRDKKWTLFTLNWLPIGGFVKLTWEIPNSFLVYNKKKKLYNNVDLEKDINKWIDIYLKNWEKIWEEDIKVILEKINENSSSENLMNKPAWQQSIIILAWVFMNFLLATIIFSILFLVWVKPIWVNTKIETDLNLRLIPTYEQALKSGLLVINEWIILSPTEWSIAKKIWIKEWDILYSIYKDCSKYESEECVNNNAYFLEKEILTTQDLIDTFQKNKNNELILYLNKNIETGLWWSYFDIKLDETWKMWAYISENITLNTEFEYNYWVIDSVKYWISETYNQTLLTFKWLWILVKKIVRPQNSEERQEAISQVSWPVWIVDFISNSIEAWIVFLLVIWAIISINLWVFNLLPIPALDWWRFIFITINWLIEKTFWKKAINEKSEAIIHVLFFVFLIALSLLIAYNDISKIIYR